MPLTAFMVVVSVALWRYGRLRPRESGPPSRRRIRPADWPNRSVFDASCARKSHISNCAGYDVCLAEIFNFNESEFLREKREARIGPPPVEPERPWCSQWSCMDRARCVQPFKLYQYTQADMEGMQLAQCLEPTNLSRPGIIEHLTDDPTRACAFWFEVRERCRVLRHVPRLKYWAGNGINHLFVIHTDEGISALERIKYFGRAAIAQGHATASRFVPGLDIALGLHPKSHTEADSALAFLPPWKRRYLLTFKGAINHRARLRAGLHHDVSRRVVLVTNPNPHQCLPSTNADRPYAQRQSQAFSPLHGDCCSKMRQHYKAYDYGSLLNTTFALVTPGRQPASYRLAEVMASGCIPIFFGFEGAMLPYGETIDWPSMSLTAPIDVDFEGKLLPLLEALANDRGRVLAMQRALRVALAHFIDRPDGSSAGDATIVETLRRRFSFEL